MIKCKAIATIKHIDEITIEQIDIEIERAQSQWDNMKVKEKEYRERDLLDFYNIKTWNNMAAEKRLRKRIITGIKKNKQRQYIFHYLLKYSGKGIWGNAKKLYEVDQNNNIIKTHLDWDSIENTIIEHNINHF